MTTTYELTIQEIAAIYDVDAKTASEGKMAYLQSKRAKINALLSNSNYTISDNFGAVMGMLDTRNQQNFRRMMIQNTKIDVMFMEGL